jgi:hypothetical protein
MALNVVTSRIRLIDFRTAPVTTLMSLIRSFGFALGRREVTPGIPLCFRN